MVHVIPFGKLQKLWAASWGDAYFLFFLVSSADLATLCNFSFFCEFKLNYLMFTDGLSNQIVCVNGNHPWSRSLSSSAKVCRSLNFKLIHAFNSLFHSRCSFELVCDWKAGAFRRLTKLLRLTSLAHWATKLLYSLAQEQNVLAPGSLTWAFFCPDVWSYVKCRNLHPKLHGLKFSAKEICICWRLLVTF